MIDNSTLSFTQHTRQGRHPCHRHPSARGGRLWASVRAVTCPPCKISRFCDLNDPFELIPFDLSNEDQRDALIHTRKELSDVGLLCFSFKWLNPLLWAHYADKHKEICLGFDLPG